VEQVVATPQRGGALVRFDVERVADVRGTLLIASGAGRSVPAFGEIAAAGQSSPIGAHGEFWLERVPAGRYEAVVDYRGGSCRFELNVPAGATGAIDLGALSCSSTGVASLVVP
jgi:outer membrane usher protein